MSQRIPDRLDPWRYADLGKSVSGVLRLDTLPRLCRCLRDSQGEVHFDLHFGRDNDRRAVMTGSISAELVLECQRCLEAVALPVEADVVIAFVEGIDQAGLLPDELDPCLVEDGEVQFRDLIEDELLLRLPQVATHEAGACSSLLMIENGAGPVDDDDRSARSPFAALADLKRDNE